MKPTSIANGAKKMHIEVPRCRIRMIDSINFLPGALSELPKMFGLEELKKGYFPHLFNGKENQSVVLNHLPDVHYYNPDAMLTTRYPDHIQIKLESLEIVVQLVYGVY